MNMVQAALEGSTLKDCFIADSHIHNVRTGRVFSRFGHCRNLLEQMDAIGIDMGIVSNLWEIEHVWERHPEVIRMWQEYPGRFYGYLSPNPNWEGFENELHRYGSHPAFVGIKLHPEEHRKDLQCKEYGYAYDFAAKQKMPVLIHTWGTDDIMRFHEIAAKYPDTILILGHAGGEEKAVAEAISLASSYENVYLDTSGSCVWHGAIEAMVDGASARKILFGSDAYWGSMEASIGRIVLADITEHDKHLILGENARRIFSLHDQEKTVMTNGGKEAMSKK